MKQTAIEWLVEKIQQANPTFKFDALIREAKEMDKEHKEELIKKACSLVFLAIGDGGDITTNEVIEILKKVVIFNP
jgi:hypothetical protein